MHEDVGLGDHTAQLTLPLLMFVEGTDAGSLSVLVKLDDVEHAVAVLPPIEQRIAAGAGQRPSGRPQRRSTVEAAKSTSSG
ncbi:hypothetical protein [Spirillospora sp. CA-128828]|uniref:hypothetical protein n=1 Tax=Spirillospora sp. CA-128828 TaxID=3240033 RepID=UPI003D94387C